MAHSLPTFTENPPDQYDVDADAALVQQSKYKKPSFFGDNSLSSNHQSFLQGVNTALSYSGNRTMKDETVSSREEGQPFRLTIEEKTLLSKRARSISNFSKVPLDTCEDFLTILCFVDKIQDMRKIADAIQLSELDNENILQKPMQILNLPRLEKICFVAQALDGLVNMFRRYIATTQLVANNSNNSEDIGSILNTLSSIIGGFGGASLGPRIETGEMGNFLSELISGDRVPTNVIAKNPMLQSPSYVGKAFFGEAATPLSNVDIDQLFNKAIALFPRNSAGAGTSSFTMQNFGSFQQSMPLINVVSKIITGSSEITSERKSNQMSSITERIIAVTGGKESDIIDIQRADNALPMMMAIATNLSGTNKSLFPSSTFKDGWVNAQSVGNQLMNIDPGFMEAARRFL